MPQASTLWVEVNGSTVSQGDGENSGSAYLSGGWAIPFGKNATPPAGACIRLSYIAACQQNGQTRPNVQVAAPL